MENSTQPSFFVPRECIHSHQMGPGSQITFFGKCTFRIPSGYLPDFTRDQFEPFQVSLLQTNMENSKKPSGFTSGNPSGTFRIPSGMQCFAHCRKPSGFPSGNPSGTFRIPSGMQCSTHCRKPSGFPSGNPSGTFRKPSGMQCFQHARFFHQKQKTRLIIF